VLDGGIDVGDVVGAVVAFPLVAGEAVLVAVPAGALSARPWSSDPHAASTAAASRTGTIAATLDRLTARCASFPLHHARY
jgi:hypothetical protein